MLKTKGIGPHGKTLSPNRLNIRSALNSKIVAVSVETKQNDYEQASAQGMDGQM